MERLSRYYNLLGIQPGATRDEIYRAYVAAGKGIHEERFADDPVVRRRAQDKLKRINEAYRALMESHEKMEELPGDLGRRVVPVSEPPSGSAPERRPTPAKRSYAPVADSSPAAEPARDATGDAQPERLEVQSLTDRTVNDHGEAGTPDPFILLRKKTGILFCALAILLLIGLIFALRKSGEKPAPAMPAASTPPVKPAEPAVREAAGKVRTEESPGKRGPTEPRRVQRSVKESSPDEALVRHDAELGVPKAQTALGYMYLVGNGVARDAGQAAEWLRKAADQGDAEAQDWLGYLYETGTGVQKNYAEAARWYRLAAEQGNADAQKNLGLMYNRGKGVEKNGREGVRWLRKAAAQGNREAQRSLDIVQEE